MRVKYKSCTLIISHNPATSTHKCSKMTQNPLTHKIKNKKSNKLSSKMAKKHIASIAWMLEEEVLGLGFTNEKL